MWSKEKILDKVSVGDDIKVTIDSGLVFRGQLVSVDDSFEVVTFVENAEEQNICMADIVSIARILKNDAEREAQNLLNKSSSKDANNKSGNSD